MSEHPKVQPRIEIPQVRTRFARWEVECDNCGVIDSGIHTRATAVWLERQHRQEHMNAIKRAEESDR